MSNASETIKRASEIDQQIAELQSEKSSYTDELKNASLGHIFSKQKFREDLPKEATGELAQTIFSKYLTDKKVVHGYNPETFTHTLTGEDGKEIVFNDFVNSFLAEKKLLSDEGLAALPAPADQTPPPANDREALIRMQLEGLNIKQPAPKVDTSNPNWMTEIQLKAFAK